MNQTPFELVRDRVDKFRQRQPGQASACCPAHEDKGPSLSIRETPDGAVLLHCFGGCAVADVVAAMGLRMSDLFPPRERPRNAPRKIARTLTPGQALEVLGFEATLCAVAAGNLAHGLSLTDNDRARLLVAANRINTIAEACK